MYAALWSVFAPFGVFNIIRNAPLVQDGVPSVSSVLPKKNCAPFPGTPVDTDIPREFNEILDGALKFITKVSHPYKIGLFQI